MTIEIIFTAESFHCGPAGRKEVEITADVEPTSVISCFSLEEVIEEKTVESLLGHMGVEKVREWLEANE